MRAPEWTAGLTALAVGRGGARTVYEPDEAAGPACCARPLAVGAWWGRLGLRTNDAARAKWFARAARVPYRVSDFPFTRGAGVTDRRESGPGRGGQPWPARG